MALENRGFVRVECVAERPSAGEGLKLSVADVEMQRDKTALKTRQKQQNRGSCMEFAPDSCSEPPLAAGESCSGSGFCFHNPISKSRQKQHQSFLVSRKVPRLHADFPGHSPCECCAPQPRTSRLRGCCTGQELLGHGPGWGKASGAPPRSIQPRNRALALGKPGTLRASRCIPIFQPGFQPGEPRAAGAEALAR